MALLTLKDIGKIYVSESNVAVGIRSVNLSFDKGEFVAVTGKSGSGKSTLLNVISGMDTYEEGELFIEGNPTSHYLQSDWEEYRQKYISFIFQDYNIIESFTVLQNVELALMNIADPKQRRKKALELIDRVGLTSHIKHKGSKLSGGQKQRTVIARALAKDSPIILADEPTGNLDSKSSKEIVELLREVSKDKLVIVVTHNFEQVEMYATRHIRVFDGAIESDHRIVNENVYKAEEKTDKEKETPKKKTKHSDLKNGIALGKSIFASKPKLTTFLCILMLVGTMGIFFVTSMGNPIGELTKKDYMFYYMDGRVVIMKQNSESIKEDEIKEIAEKYGADSYLHYDFLLDSQSYFPFEYYDEEEDFYESFNIHAGFDEEFGKNIIGRYPEKDNEVFLYLPISLKPTFGEKEIIKKDVACSNVALNVVGIKYYCDNNKVPRCIFTLEGFKNMTSAAYMSTNDCQFSLEVKTKNIDNIIYIRPKVSYSTETGKLSANIPEYTSIVATNKDAKVKLIYRCTHFPNKFYVDSIPEKTFIDEISGDKIIPTPTFLSDFEKDYQKRNDIYSNVTISPYLLTEIIERDMEENYKQASLFFENDKKAEAIAEQMQNDGYIAVPSNSTCVPDPMSAIMETLASVFAVIMWVVAIMFLGLFINLCSSRSMAAFRSDMGIMRSMGISVKTIRTGMYVRMLLCLIPGVIAVILTAILIFTTPAFNKHFVYMYFGQYMAIFLGMLILTIFVTHRQIKRLFKTSVKKSLKGGNA